MGGADIFSCKRRRVVKKSIVRKGRRDEGKETVKSPPVKYRRINRIT